MLYYLLRIVHIAAMGTWFGVSLLAAGDLRRTLAAGPAHVDLLLARFAAISRVASAAGWTTVLSGLALIFSLGGFGKVPHAIHAGLLLALVLVGLGIATGMQGQKAALALKAGADPGPARKRAGMFGGIAHLLWFVILCLMVLTKVVG